MIWWPTNDNFFFILLQWHHTLSKPLETPTKGSNFSRKVDIILLLIASGSQPPLSVCLFVVFCWLNEAISTASYYILCAFQCTISDISFVFIFNCKNEKSWFFTSLKWRNFLVYFVFWGPWSVWWWYFVARTNNYHYNPWYMCLVVVGWCVGSQK